MPRQATKDKDFTGVMSLSQLERCSGTSGDSHDFELLVVKEKKMWNVHSRQS